MGNSDRNRQEITYIPRVAITEESLMKAIKLLSLMLGLISVRVYAMEEPQVLLKVTNTGTETTYVQAYEYETGRFYGGTYKHLSEIIPIEPAQTEEILVNAQSDHTRYLYYYHESIIDPENILSRLSIPIALDDDYATNVKGIQPGETTLLQVTNAGDTPVYVQVVDYQYGSIKGT